MISGRAVGVSRSINARWYTARQVPQVRVEVPREAADTCPGPKVGGREEP